MSGSKLSLSKKLQKFARVKDKPKEKLVNVFTETVNLNETSEFQNASRSSNAVTGGRLKRKCKEKPEELGDNCADGKGADGDAVSYTCQVCSKELSHMSVQRRQQHVNRCIDQTEDVEKQKKEEERLLESARNAVLNCPMCGKQFKSSTARLGHLKKCSRENNVTTDRLLQLIKDQEKERADQLAAGIIPQELRSRITKSAVVKKRKLKEPKNQYEEDVQVAMAISSSITGEQHVTGSTVSKGKASGRKKDKEMMEDVCLLTTLSDEDRQKRMEEKINNILQMSINHTTEPSATLYESELKASHQSASLWNICSCSPDSRKKEEFYVGALIPPICTNSGVKPVRNLRRFSSIPGREKSFIETNQELIEKGLDTSSNLSPDDIISVSTQTAVVLAELAADHTEDTDILNVSQPRHSTSDCDMLEASGFCVDMMALDDSVQEKLYTDTLTDYRKLVNNPEHSDVDIISSSGDTVYAHKLILLLRSPSILQAVKESTIHLDYPSVVVKSALKFLYTGELTVALSAQNELKKLAMQFELAPLISACDKLKLIESKGRDEVDGVATDVSEKETTELNMKEIWGESDSEEDNDDAVKDDNVSLSDEEIEDDDYQDIMATQRKSLKNREKVGYTDKTEIDLKGTEVVERPTKLRTTRNTRLKSSNVKVVDSTSDIKVAKVPVKCDLPEAADDDKVTDLDDNMPKSKRLRLSNELENADDDKLTEVDDSIPKPKRLRLSNELENAGNDKVTDVDDNMPKPKRLQLSNELENTECNHVKYEQNEWIVLSDNSEEDMSMSGKHEGNDCSATKTVIDKLPVDDVSGVELNDSYCVNTSVDLFASPSPPPKSDPSDVRHIQTMSGKEGYLGSLRSPSRTLVANNDTNDKSVGESKDLKDLECSKLSHDEEFSNVRGNVSDRGRTDSDKDELDENSGDDIEIIGDNFNEICTPSPTFNRSKTNSMPRFESPELDVRSKYLGLESKIQARCDKYPGSDGNLGDSNDDSDEVILMQTEDEVDAGKSEDDNLKADGKNVQLCGLAESVSHDEGIPVDLVDSEIPELVPADDETVGDTAEPGSNSSDTTSESENQRSPTIPTIHSESFQVHSDVWEDFDDCGVVYEPSFVSPELPASQVPTGSPVRLELPASQVLTALPKPSCSKSEQDEVIDLSQTEEDDTTCGVQVEDDSTCDVQVEDNTHCDMQLEDNTHCDMQLEDNTHCDMQLEDNTHCDMQLEDNTHCDMQLEDNTHCDMQLEDNTHCDMQLDDELCQDFLQDGDDSFVFKVDEINDDTKQQASAKNTTDKVWKFKTPVVKRTDNKKKVWMVPSPFTPMPKYTQMATPVLKKEVHKFGVKAVGKKRMVKILEDIYQQTHQYETDSDLDEDEDDDKSGDAESTTHDSDSPGDIGEDLMASQGDISSQESRVVMEESCLHMSSSDSDTTCSPQKNVDVTKKLMQYFKSHPELHLKVLTYEPIELDVLKKDVKEYGIKCSMDKLMDFLDEKCIAFTTKNSRKNRAQKKKGKKKSSTSKNSKKDT